MNRIACLGRAAYQVLEEASAQRQAGRVHGVTSRGVFLQVGAGWIVFLSREAYRGPLTANLAPGALGLIDAVELHQPVEVGAGKLRFTQAGEELAWAGSPTWQAPPPAVHAADASQRMANYQMAAAQLIAIKEGGGYSSVLARLAGLDLGLPWDAEQERTWQAVRAARQAMERNDADGIAHSLVPLLGRGSGLTPSGDDLAAGFLLALNRWGAAWRAGLDRERLNVLLSEAALQRTTLLSANLVACAAQGEADERLITALDGLVTGAIPAQACAEALAVWGHSSGLDSMIGQGLMMIEDC